MEGCLHLCLLSAVRMDDLSVESCKSERREAFRFQIYFLEFSLLLSSFVYSVTFDIGTYGNTETRHCLHEILMEQKL